MAATGTGGMNRSGSARTINPLSNPKGTTHECELCHKPAFLVCQCGVTYYCCEEHQETDWQGIHDKICMLLPPLRNPAPVIGSEEERDVREHTLRTSRRALIDLTRNEASKFLVAGQFELAIPGALQALRFSLDVHGEGAVEVVPAYLLLAEANLGLGRFRQAEEFLSMANWSVLKNPDCSNALRSKLHRNFGKLYASQARFDEALKELANDVFYSSLEIGPEHIDTAGGYYHMATIFFSRNQINHALAFYDKVVDIWYKFLVGVRHGTEDIEGVSEAALHEAMAMLRNIAGTREQFLGATHIASGEAQYTMGLLHFYTGAVATSQSCIQSAASVYMEHLGADHPSTKDVRAVLAEVQDKLIAMRDDGSGPQGYGGLGDTGASWDDTAAVPASPGVQADAAEGDVGGDDAAEAAESKEKAAAEAEAES